MIHMSHGVMLPLAEPVDLPETGKEEDDDYGTEKMKVLTCI